MKKLLKISMLSLGVAASGGAFAQGACSVNYEAVNSWGSGAQIKTTITNNGGALNGWELCYSYSGNDAIQNLWDGTFTQTGKNVCVKNAGYNGSLPAAGTASFGFIVNNPGAVPTSYTLNGVACGGVAASSTPSSTPTPSSRSSSTTPLFSSSSSSSVAPSVATRWSVNGTKSTFNFVAVKKINTAENFTFTTLQGTVNSNGQANLTIPLSSIVTGIDIRNTRMQSMLFETDFMPSLHFSTQLSLTEIDGMAVGSISTKSFTGSLTLHGITKDISFDALVVKHDANNFSVSPRKAIVINSVDFDLASGIETLRTTAALDAIGQKVPVYFKLFLTKDNAANVAPIQLAAAPAAPLNLLASLSQVTGVASLNWSDVSNNETGFVVRRKDAAGLWSTVKGTAANTSSYQDTLTTAGAYDYKVIAFNGSMPSPASNAVSVTLTTGTVPSSAASSSVIVSSSSVGTLNGATLFTQQCTSCHALTDSFPKEKNQATLATYITNNMPIQNPALCGTDCGSAIATYLLAPRSSSSTVTSSSAGTVVGNAANGAVLFGQRCASCHGVDGEKNANGTIVAVALNPNRSEYRHSQDTQARALKDFIAMWMPPSGAGTCTGQCAADIEAHIFSWRAVSDGKPDNPVSAFSCPSNAPSYGQRTLRLLTKNEYQRSMKDLVGYQADLTAGLPSDFISGAFVNNNTLVIDKGRYTSYLANAERIATDVATRWNAVLGCTPSSSCASTLVNTLGPRIFRRPLTTEEQTAYLNVANGTTGGRTVTDGMNVALTAMLSSPQFLYRSEVGALSSSGIYKLDGYEMATYLSYTYTGSTPSTALMQAAANGTLNTAAGVRTQAATLLGNANTKLLLTDLVNRWLLTDKIETLIKPAITNFATLGADMKQELGKNFAGAMLDSASTFGAIYNPGYTYVNSRLAAHYGLPFSGAQDADGFVKVSTQERGGILMSGAFMTRYSSPTDSNMITRAVALRRKLMCQDIPEPPAGVSLDREALAARDKVFYEDPHTTQRMIFERITAGTSCANCHGEIINPLGGAMENFDTAGRVRSTDLKGNAIVSSGTFYSPYPQLQFLNDPDRVIYSPSIQINGAADLARTIAEQPQVSGLAQTCLATQFVSYSSGINSIFLIDSKRDVGYTRISTLEEQAYRCDIADLTNVLATRGPRAMLEEIPALESVMYRKEWAR